MITPSVYISMDVTNDAEALEVLEQYLTNTYGIVSSMHLWLEEDRLDFNNNKEELSQLVSLTSITIVVIGESTGNSNWVDFEIKETLRRKNGLLALTKPLLEPIRSSVPSRLQLNLDSGSGYAGWYIFPRSRKAAIRLVRRALGASRKKIRLGNA